MLPREPTKSKQMQEEHKSRKPVLLGGLSLHVQAFADTHLACRGDAPGLGPILDAGFRWTLLFKSSERQGVKFAEGI